MASLCFKEANSGCFDDCSLDGVALSQLDLAALRSWTKAQGIPDLPEAHARMVLCALGLALGTSSVGGSQPLWKGMREETRGLMVLAIRREGYISTATAAALNLLNKPQVVEKYKMYGNRWTTPEAARETLRERTAAAEGREELARAREALGAGGSQPLGEWLRSLGDVLDEEPNPRPWYMSKTVLIILSIAALFVFVHVVLLMRVLQKIHTADSSVLMMPMIGLGASAAVGGLAVGLNKLSELSAPAPKKPLKASQ